MVDKTLTTEKKSVFETLNKIKVKTEKKGRFNYTPWTIAWEEVKKKYPNSIFKVYEREIVKDGVLYSTGMPVFKVNDNAGAFVKVGVIIEDIEYIEFYPITDHYNKSIPYERITTMDINTAIKRALVKAIAYSGLGLYVFEGEELPKEEE